MARGIAAGDGATAIAKPNQSADVTGTCHAADGIGVGDAATVASNQPAHLITYAADIAGGVAGVNVAIVLVIPHQAAHLRARGRHRNRGVAVADRTAVVAPHQSANVVYPLHRAGGIAVSDGAQVVAHQATDIKHARHSATSHAQVFDAAARRCCNIRLRRVCRLEREFHYVNLSVAEIHFCLF